MWSWETLLHGRLERGAHDYWEHDAPAESALVDSVLDWIESARSLREPKHAPRKAERETEHDGNRSTGFPGRQTAADQGAEADHPLALAKATAQYAVLLAAYRSAIERRPLALPADDESPAIDALRAALSPAAAPS